MKIYATKNVYDAAMERLDYIFSRFDNIYVAFSGGKDSGVLWNLVLRYMSEHRITRTIGLFHQDFEAQYQQTSDYVERVFTTAPDFTDRFWCCIPQQVENSLSIYEPFWYTWDDRKEELWGRPMPQYPYVYNLHNHPFDFYRYQMPEKEFHNKFTRWYQDHCGGGSTVGLIGLRSDESLNRYAAVSAKVHMDGDHPWTADLGHDCYTAYPIYDWTVEDVWTANGKFGWDYNRLYDLYYKAGIPIDQMRVASPFLAQGRANLSVYRVIDAKMWAKLVGRVNGADFGAIYGGTEAVAYREIKLPPGHTWETYTRYLLSTLPKEAREHYEAKFARSVSFWQQTGGGLTDQTIREIRDKGYQVEENGYSAHAYAKDHIRKRVVFDGIPDDTDDIQTTVDLPSWKRMCMCILRNDYTCKSMGFAPPSKRRSNLDSIKKKYSATLRGKKNV